MYWLPYELTIISYPIFQRENRCGSFELKFIQLGETVPGSETRGLTAALHCQPLPLLLTGEPRLPQPRSLRMPLHATQRAPALAHRSYS